MFHFKKVKYKQILDIEELHIPAQKVTCIVGQSGSGKTTLLRLLNQLISSDEGEITWQGTLLDEISPIKLRREVVMLPQMPSVFPGTVADNLQIGLKYSEKPLAHNDLLMEVLKKVHLHKSLSDDADRLSGGEKQRLALARVLLLNPEVYLLDEPSSALDESTEHLLIESLVKNSKENNKTLIMVTHSKKIAVAYSDYIIEIQNGSVIRQEEVHLGYDH